MVCTQPNNQLFLTASPNQAWPLKGGTEAGSQDTRVQKTTDGKAQPDGKRQIQQAGLCPTQKQHHSRTFADWNLLPLCVGTKGEEPDWGREHSGSSTAADRCPKEEGI